MGAASSSTPIPVGNYPAKFVEFAGIETKCGKAYRWVFHSDDGKTISEISDGVATPTPNNRTGRFLMALTGKALQVGEKINPESYYGQRYFVIVTPKGTEGKTQIATFSKM